MFSSVFLTLSAMIYLSELSVSFASEPVCSKFSYEEKLLEKMIRTEIKVETMQKEIKKTEESVLNTLVDIEKTAAKTEIKFEEIRNNLTGEVVTHVEDLNNKEENLQNKFEELKNNFTREMENKMEIVLVEVKKNMVQTTVAFHAHNVKDLKLDVTNEVLVFQNVITNEGSGYDSSTGIFTASVEGVYQLTAHVCAAYLKFAPIGLVLDGSFIARSANYNMYNDDTNAGICSSVSAIVKLLTGRKVWVACTYGREKNLLAADDTYSMNTFSGVRIN